MIVFQSPPIPILHFSCSQATISKPVFSREIVVWDPCANVRLQVGKPQSSGRCCVYREQTPKRKPILRSHVRKFQLFHIFKVRFLLPSFHSRKLGDPPGPEFGAACLKLCGSFWPFWGCWEYPGSFCFGVLGGHGLNGAERGCCWGYYLLAHFGVAKWGLNLAAKLSRAGAQDTSAVFGPMAANPSPLFQPLRTQSSRFFFFSVRGPNFVLWFQREIQGRTATKKDSPIECLLRDGSHSRKGYLLLGFLFSSLPQVG